MKYKTWIYVIIILLIIYLGLIFFDKENNNKNSIEKSVKIDIEWKPIFKDKVNVDVNTNNIDLKSIKNTDLKRNN